MNATRKSLFRGIVTGFMGLVMIINAGLTFVFGGTYGAETFPTSLPALSFILGGLMLTVFYDFAAVAWFLARGRDGQSVTQRGIATGLAVASMLASTTVSAIQLAMTTNLIDLSPLHGAVGIVGLVMMIVMAGSHFIGIFFYQASDPAYAEADAAAALQAEVATFKITEKEAINEKVMLKTKQIMNGQIDGIAEVQAQQLWSDLYADLNTLPPTAPSKAARVIDQQPEAVPPTTAPDLPSMPEPVVAASHVNGNGRYVEHEDFLANSDFE